MQSFGHRWIKSQSLGGHMVERLRRTYNGDLGTSPQWGSRAEPLTGGHGQSSREAEHLFTSSCNPRSWPNFPEICYCLQTKFRPTFGGVAPDPLAPPVVLSYVCSRLKVELGLNTAV